VELTQTGKEQHKEILGSTQRVAIQEYLEGKTLVNSTWVKEWWIEEDISKTKIWGKSSKTRVHQAMELWQVLVVCWPQMINSNRVILHYMKQQSSKG
jgi:hypothetical protein